MKRVVILGVLLSLLSYSLSKQEENCDINTELEPLKEKRIHDTVYLPKYMVEKVTDKATCKFFYRVGIYNVLDGDKSMNIDQYDSVFEVVFNQHP